MRPRRTTLAVAGIGAAFALACGYGEPVETIERDAFTRTYADLRIAALETDSQRIGAPERDSILAQHGVSEEDLLLFVEVHSSDVELMRDVWNDVELLMDRQPEMGR